jgi:predicted MFS family arabinose efflux permease
MEFGIGVGAFLSGMLYANRAQHFDSTFLVCGLLAGIAFVFLLFLKKPRPDVRF